MSQEFAGTPAVAVTVTGIASTDASVITSGHLTINGTSVGAVGDGADTPTLRATALITAVNTVSATTGVVASNAAATTVLLTSASGKKIVVAFAGASATTATTGLTAATTTNAVVATVAAFGTGPSTDDNCQVVTVASNLTVTVKAAIAMGFLARVSGELVQIDRKP